MAILIINGTGLGPRTLAFDRIDHHGLEFDTVSRALRGGLAPFDPRDAVANTKVLDAIFRSERSGGWETAR